MSERSRRRWLVAGIASAVLNVFLIGFLAGRQAFGPAGCTARGFMREPDNGLRVRIADGERARLRERLELVRKARERVRAELAREPYAAAQLESALTALRERSLEVQLDMHRMLLGRASQLSAPERKRLADSRLLRRPLGLQP